MIIFYIPKRAALHYGLPEYNENVKCEFGHEAYRDVITNICSECELNFQTFSSKNKQILSNLNPDGDKLEYERKLALVRLSVIDSFKTKFKARRKYHKMSVEWDKEQKRLAKAYDKKLKLEAEIERKRNDMGKKLFNDYRDIMK